MKCNLPASRNPSLLVSLALGLGVFAAGAKPIRLRNETIATDRPATASAVVRLPAAEAPASGLLLLQFKSTPQPAWREQLKSRGVELLRYVPDDAFVVRGQGVRLEELRTLPFVEWVGAYRPEHKVQHGLQLSPAGKVTGPIPVKVLVSPHANAQEINDVRRLLTNTLPEAKLRSGIVLRGAVNPAQLHALAQSDSVLWVEPAAKMRLMDEVSSKIVAGDGGPNVTLCQTLGLDGAGVTVAVADSGLNNGDAATMHPDLFGRVTAFFRYGSLTDAADEHSHGTHVTGIIAGDGATGETDENGALYGLGVAPGASIIAQRIFDGVGNYEPPPSFETLTRDAKRAGADIGSNSWGDDTQGRYDLSAMEFDELVRDADALASGDQPYILEFSAGNAGPGAQTIGSPAVAKNVIATGASQNDRLDLLIYDGGPDAMADFSSRGPCEDGRIKPDVVAPGTWIASLQSAAATDENAWAAIDNFYQYQGGTSQAGPHVSAAAAVFVQFYRQTHTNATPSPALVKAALINSAVDMDDTVETGPAPNIDEGWGRVDLTQIIGSERSLDMVDQTALLTNGQVFERRVLLASSDEPLKVTLAYTDVPGFPGAIPALVNDLDLEVVAPDGHVHHGNQFDQGESLPDAPGRDSINNVEGILIRTPLAGEYIVRVRATRVVEDARADTFETTDQDFGLVISGDLASPGASVLVLDRRSYTAPGRMKITLYDHDRTGSPSVVVTNRSTTESPGEALTLIAADANGRFTGSIATATGPAVADGQLQIAHGDTIQVSYSDTSAGTDRIATAQADLLPPVLSNVAATNEFGFTLVTWISDEPANSAVRFGTNPVSLMLAATNSALTTEHAVELDGLVGGLTYYFQVVSTDEAGNTTTNGVSNFVAQPAAQVLLVDAYVDLLFAVPPLSGYTDPLDQISISYDVWDTSVLGSPAAADLKHYRAVIWRLPEFMFGSAPLSPAEQNALADYLRGGGSLLVSSMEALTRLDEGGFSGFRQSVLHVQAYVPDAGVSEIFGNSSDPVGGNIDAALDYSPYADSFKELLEIPEDVSDTISPTPDAVPVFFDDFGAITGLRFPRTGLDSTGRVVFLSFPLDAVPMTGGSTNNRVQLLRNIMEFLVPGFDGRATLALDSLAYSVPGLVTVEVNDTDQAGSVNVTCSSETQTNATSLALVETAQPGIFRGIITLLPPTNPPASGGLCAQDGDIITVSYHDASAAITLQASAIADTITPALTGVAAVPDYESATISWNTTEPCDSLVQFGESSLLGRAAYDSTPTTSHELALQGLLPDTTYYFQVVSRDAAGNTATADNGGGYYTVHTLSAMLPPWSDNLTDGATNWSLFDSDDSQSHWTLGVPANGVETGAHSPTNAWGSSLNGDYLDYAETFLVSPAIQLTGGNSARLTFWHSYDFSPRSPDDIIEQGTLYLITNSVGDPVPLAAFTDANSGWEEEEIDLTPYVGHVLYLVWAYQLYSFEAERRPGWLVDDISITVSNIGAGTIQITNNLWQARFVLTGPLNRNGQGANTLITNAPPGPYLINFADVQFYQTPGSQTNDLAAGGSWVVQGNYTFADVNTNGISDAWEQLYFGTVSTNRTHLSDTDGDGLSDYGEFVAGTNPTNAASNFQLAAPVVVAHATLQLRWQSAPGRAYRVHGSSDGLVWFPVSDWIPGTSGTASYLTPLPASGGAYLFRVEASP